MFEGGCDCRGVRYRMTRPFATKLVEQFKETGVKVRKLKDDEISPMPADFFFMNRLQFGFYSVLARLDVEVDYSAVERAFLPKASQRELGATV